MMIFARRSLGLSILAMGLSAAGCRNVSETKQQNLRTGVAEPATPPRGEPVEIPDSFNSARAYYQSRGVISLSVKSSAVKSGDQFSLINDTTAATLIAAQNSGLNLGVNGGDFGAGWALIDAYEVTLKLYPLDPAFVGKFAYGENKLRLLVAGQDGAADRMAKSEITLFDFPAFAFTTTTFDSGEQRTNGLQGGFESLGNTMVTSSGQGFLASGFLGVVNQ